MIRGLIGSWGTEKTIKQLIKEKESLYDNRLTDWLILILEEYNPQILNMPMVGEITTGLNLKETDFIPISMSSVFERLCRDSRYNFDVVDYLKYVLYEILEKTKDADIINTAIGRSLRSFPSFLRELDLQLQIEAALNEKTSHSSDLDMKAHADLYFRHNEKDYYLWSYTNTVRAREKAKDKFLGNRGELPKGVHILAPFSLDVCDTINGWKLYGISTIRFIVHGVDNITSPCTYENFCSSATDDTFRSILFIEK